MKSQRGRKIDDEMLESALKPLDEPQKQIDIRLDPWDGGVSIVLSTNGELLQSVALQNAAARRLAWALLQTTEV